jgi:tetratricopeptide (TPR) repeat protein
MHKKKYTIFLVLLFVVVLVYGNSLSGRFIWDDRVLIVDNPLIRDHRNFQQVFRSELHPQTHTNYYRPLQTISFKTDYALYKLRPFGYHLTNLLLHLLAGIFLFLFLQDITQKNFLPFAASLLFLVHPIQTEAVSYISGRADLLVALFSLVSMFCYTKARLPDRHRDPFCLLFYMTSMVFAVLALLSKETAIVLPLMILGVTLFMLKDKRKTLERVGPFFGIVLAYGFLRMTFLNFAAGDPFLTKKGFAVFDINLVSRTLSFLKTLVLYLGALFIPINLHMERLVPFEKIYIFHWLGLGSCLALFLFSIVLARSDRQKRNLLIFSAYWFFIWLLPQSSFVFPQVAADHFLYLPSIGVFLTLALGIDMLDNQYKKSLTLFLLFIIYGTSTVFYNTQWRQELPFFLRTARLSPYSFRAHDSLALLYLKTHETEKAIHEYKLIIDPYGNAADQEDLEVFARQAWQEPTFWGRRELVSLAFYNLGVIFNEEQKEGDAIQAYGYALKINPQLKTAYNNLGLIYEKRGMPAQAEESYKKAIGLDNQYAQAYNNLAELYAKKGDLKKAIFLWKKALEIKPDYEIASQNIALAEELIKKR